MAVKESGSVRMGPLSLFVLVIVLCMAVLAVLSFATARASSSEASRQVEFTLATYANEEAAQEYVAEVDAQLARVARKGGSLDDAMRAVRAVSPDVAKIEGSRVSVAFSCDGNRRLNVTLAVNDDLSYTVTKWKTSVGWVQTDEGQNFWPGK